jgi:hypothetical protein
MLRTCGASKMLLHLFYKAFAHGAYQSDEPPYPELKLSGAFFPGPWCLALFGAFFFGFWRLVLFGTFLLIFIKNYLCLAPHLP